MPRKLHIIVSLTAAVALLGASGLMAQGPNPRPGLWAGCETYTSVVTRTSFKPDHGNFDELYAGGNGFKDGLPLISDAAPGDVGYTGGRWHLNVLKDGVDPDKYANACSAGALDMNDFDSTDTYFECPVLPSNN